VSVGPYSTIPELGRALRRREVSAVELAKQCLSRLDSLGRRHNAVVRLLESQALEAARAADERLRRGRPKGPLDGIPFGIKDMFATKGIPTTWGSPAHANQVFDYDATAVKRLRNAGAVLVAKLAMIELAGGGNYNMAGASATGPCLCAHDKLRWAGGSSSGSGACVALGCVPFALGSETWGSITCPSAFNGVSGLRPTYGRTSRFGAMALCWTHDKVGALARTAEDAATVVVAISGKDPNDPSTLDEKPDFSPRYGRKSKLRIGVLQEDFAGSKADRCEAAHKSALKTFESLGHAIVSVAYPDLPYATAMELIVNAEGASAHENFLRSEKIDLLPDKDQIAGLLASLNTSAVDYLWALRFRTQALRANEIWKKCDCIFTPVFYHAAPPAEGKFGETWKNMGGDSGPANLLGWPALAFPIGMDGALPAESEKEAAKQGFREAPIGGHVIAPAMREDVCLRVASEFQRATRHHLRRPGE
jgi:aspartyl-tRNA(Asn)/glutamyl-tRNA(Gln) amidotransferase subunit A